MNNAFARSRGRRGKQITSLVRGEYTFLHVSKYIAMCSAKSEKLSTHDMNRILKDNSGSRGGKV